MQRIENYQGAISSGLVFDRKLPINNKVHNPFQQNRILLCLIEEEMELSFRSQHCLNESGIKLIGQLVQKAASELLDLKNFGRTSLIDIEKNLFEMSLTLEMNLDFFPWNGDGNGSELIQILSLQKPSGGFFIDNRMAEKLDIDLKELDQSVSKKKQSLLHTKYLLARLELKFEKVIPYLTALLKPHRQWLEKESR